MKPGWKKYLLYGSAIIFLSVLAYLLIETVRAKNTGFETKTLWDWMELLIIPLALALAAFALNRSETNLERQSVEARSKVEREIAIDHQQEEALQSYLDRMTELLLKEDLRNTDNEEVQNVARIRTLSVLRGLDARRKGLVLQFLHESKLLDGEKPVVILWDADLSEAELSDVILNRANLGGVILRGANLEGADLTEASLDHADLEFANLQGATLVNVVLSGASLKNAFLSKANFTGAVLKGAKFEGAIMPDGTKHD
jgi:uncharacterized protein YjbI with pentapeptide repeats